MVGRFKFKMASMMLGDSKLESLTPSVNAPYLLAGPIIILDVFCALNLLQRHVMLEFGHMH
jgi:hypothetical protein